MKWIWLQGRWKLQRCQMWDRRSSRTWLVKAAVTTLENSCVISTKSALYVPEPRNFIPRWKTNRNASTRTSESIHTNAYPGFICYNQKWGKRKTISMNSRTGRLWHPHKWNIMMKWMSWSYMPCRGWVPQTRVLPKEAWPKAHLVRESHHTNCKDKQSSLMSLDSGWWRPLGGRRKGNEWEEAWGGPGVLTHDWCVFLFVKIQFLS